MTCHYTTGCMFILNAFLSGLVFWSMHIPQKPRVFSELRSYSMESGMVCKYAMRTRSPFQFDRIPAHNWHGCTTTPNCQFIQKCVLQKQCPECEPRAHNLKSAYGASNGCQNARHVSKMRAWASFSTLYIAFCDFVMHTRMCTF